jgi:hypothetical protein
LPPVISGHNAYWHWGYGNATGKLIITLRRGDLQDLKERYGKYFDSIEYAGIFQHKYVMPYENNLNILICRELKVPMDELWKKVKSFG